MLQREARKRREAEQAYREAGRTERADQEAYERSVLGGTWRPSTRTAWPGWSTRRWRPPGPAAPRSSARSWAASCPRSGGPTATRSAGWCWSASRGERRLGAPAHDQGDVGAGGQAAARPRALGGHPAGLAAGGVGHPGAQPRLGQHRPVVPTGSPTTPGTTTLGRRGLSGFGGFGGFGGFPGCGGCGSSGGLGGGGGGGAAGSRRSAGPARAAAMKSWKMSAGKVPP